MPINHADRDLAHIVSMIGQLQRLLEQEAQLSSLPVFQVAYWRARIQWVASQTTATGATADRAFVLLAKLDALNDANASRVANGRRINR
ncbi:hypothetical protein [Paraburkholderia graminis]|uniref:Uncharacterized protein n=1 Tax=Paraburkholderia graminis TaxID=60548 RepID=A0ABD5CRD6_9BURK|nr:hypothetical protein [Paraburkholderia graminis]MDR6207893.1 hypothetical protein [Paraburkholderia graminis]